MLFIWQLKMNTSRSMELCQVSHFCCFIFVSLKVNQTEYEFVNRFKRGRVPRVSREAERKRISPFNAPSIVHLIFLDAHRRLDSVSSSVANLHKHSVQQITNRAHPKCLLKQQPWSQHSNSLPALASISPRLHPHFFHPLHEQHQATTGCCWR